MKHCKVQSREGRVFMETLLDDEIVSDKKKWSLIKFIILMVGRYLDSSRIQVRNYR